MSKILGIGNALVDIMVDLPDETLLKKYSLAKGSQEHVDKAVFDQVYQELPLDGARYIPGGSTANTISALANLEHKTAFIGVIGDDEYGRMFEEDVNQTGIYADLIKKQGDTGRILHLITPDQKKTIVGYKGVSDELVKADLKDKYLSSYSHLLIDGYLVPHETFVQALADMDDLRYLKIVFDLAGSHIAEGHREFLKRFIKGTVDILFANDLEAFSYSGIEPGQAIHSMAKDCEIVVIKLGAKGSLIQRGSEFYTIPAAPSAVQDTTGAGDLYAAGFLYGLMKNYHLTHCGKIASFLASKILEVEGARLAYHKWREVKKMI
jgi:sugar/nucleoside kinase (ribokinase family)